eukprot:g5441.t1
MDGARGELQALLRRVEHAALSRVEYAQKLELSWQERRMEQVRAEVAALERDARRTERAIAGAGESLLAATHTIGEADADDVAVGAANADAADDTLELPAGATAGVSTGEPEADAGLMRRVAALERAAGALTRRVEAGDEARARAEARVDALESSLERAQRQTAELRRQAAAAAAALRSSRAREVELVAALEARLAAQELRSERRLREAARAVRVRQRRQQEQQGQEQGQREGCGQNEGQSETRVDKCGS